MSEVDKIIEAHVDLHCLLQQQAGTVVTAAVKHRYRESLRGLVRLAEAEFMVRVEKDMASVKEILK